MCGICGKIYFDTSKKVDPSLIDRMTSVLNHRGPDDRGVYAEANVGLGHQRLSIIDLSSAGHQPMTNEDNSIRIVYNGEIYNFDDLRKELEAKGHVFRSQTDTEVIIHLYEEEGTDCVCRLRGMFAFAIWDFRQQQLFLARDRAGKKPLVYASADGAFLFASEIKSLLKDPAVNTQVNPEALHHYLTYQYVPGPQTIFKGIHKLPPAHRLVLRNGKITLNRYWNLSYSGKLKLAGLSDYKEKFRDVFCEAVKIRMRSDVPLGAFLSGGIDSSATVAVMSRFANAPIKTFAIGFEESDFNELQYARTVAQQFQTEHTEFVVKPDALKILPKIIWHYDEPFADPSAIPTYYVSKLTREHVTVALNGDGGDESFAGYERYIANRLAAVYAKIPFCLREKIIKKAVNRLSYREYRWSFSRRLKRFINGIAEEPAASYVQWLCYFNNEMKESLYAQSFSQQVTAFDSVALTAEMYDKSDADNLLEKTLFADVMLYLPYDLLVKVDIASMAHSLEARSPFLDHKVMEFAASLPASLKLRGLQTKYILKKAFEDLLPKQILYRKKMGFGVPLLRWFQHELKPVAYDILLDHRTTDRGYFKRDAVKLLLDEHAGLQADHSYRIWALLLLELWHRMFIDKSEVLGI
jgi:asparagine synthase (glutamine-hydrolysing)